jgi:hypothetical protein
LEGDREVDHAAVRVRRVQLEVDAVRVAGVGQKLLRPLDVGLGREALRIEEVVRRDGHVGRDVAVALEDRVQHLVAVDSHLDRVDDTLVVEGRLRLVHGHE